MVDRERVRRLLDRASADLRKLRRYEAARPEPLAEGWLDSVKYAFVTTVEGCGRIAHHIVVSEGWRVAETNAEAVRTLARNGVLDAATAEPVASAVGFRNILVHEYVDVDDGEVVRNLGRLGDLERFVAEVAAWLEAQSPPPGRSPS